MKLLVRMYRMLNRVRTPKAAEFDRLYRLNHDPYDTTTSPYELHKQKALVRMIGERRYASALDLGCGTGVVTRLIAPFCDRVLGTDFAPTAIETARRETSDSRVSFAVADLREMEEVGAYDLIVCSEVLYYLKAPELADALVRLSRALMPGGALVLVARSDDDYLAPALQTRFTATQRVEDTTWERPFAITRWEPKAA